jgi:putative membrane protein
MPTADRTRDHLANERTFLSWTRTALALLGFGFVLARMGLFLRQLAAAAPQLPGSPHPPHGGDFMAVGMVVVVLGTTVAAWAGWHYRRTRQAIDAGQYEPAGASVLALVAVIVIGGLVIIALTIMHELAPLS